MGKALYGKGSKGRAGRSGRLSDGSIWVTVTATLPEDKLHELIVQSFADARAPPEVVTAADLHDSLAASLIEYAAERKADCDESWIGLLQELCTDMGISLADPDAMDGDDCGNVSKAERAGAEALVACLKQHRVLCDEPPPPPPLAIGSAVLAILEEDGDWHEAVVTEKTDAGGLGRAPRFAVRFVEWAKVQETSRAHIVSLVEVADDEDDNEDESAGQRKNGDSCELCARNITLTFHHLIPKETHARYLTRGSLPEGVAEAAIANGLEPEPLTREFLHRYGVSLCRYCHTTVHRLAPNAVLAERFNTLEKLHENEQISKFVAFAARQKLSAK